MNKKIAVFFMLVCHISMACAGIFETHSSDLASEQNKAINQGKTIAILFELDNCPNCLEQRQKALSNAAINQAFSARFHTLVLNLGQDTPLVDPKGKSTTLTAFARSIRVFGTPAVAFFDAKGTLITRIDSPLGESAELLLLGHYVANATYETRPFSEERQHALSAARKIKGEKALNAYLKARKQPTTASLSSTPAISAAPGKPCCDPAKHASLTQHTSMTEDPSSHQHGSEAPPHHAHAEHHATGKPCDDPATAGSAPAHGENNLHAEPSAGASKPCCDPAKANPTSTAPHH